MKDIFITFVVLSSFIGGMYLLDWYQTKDYVTIGYVDANNLPDKIEVEFQSLTCSGYYGRIRPLIDDQTLQQLYNDGNGIDAKEQLKEGEHGS